MNDLIRRADAIEAVRKRIEQIGYENDPLVLSIRQAVINVPSALTVDVEPVRHAKWIPCAKSGLILTEQMRKEGIRWYGFKCSACNFVRKGNAPRDAIYCECCGSRMDEDNVE